MAQISPNLSAGERSEVKKKPKLFLGLESSNLNEFESKCCRAGIYVEPLTRITCGQCGKTVRDKDVTWLAKGTK